MRQTREQYLPLLEEWRAKTESPLERVLVEAEIRRLRRLLGITVTSDEVRRATRERVRQHRERKKQGVVLRPRRKPAPPVTAESIAADARRQGEVWREIERIKRQAKAEAAGSRKASPALRVAAGAFRASCVTMKTST